MQRKAKGMAILRGKVRNQFGSELGTRLGLAQGYGWSLLCLIVMLSQFELMLRLDTVDSLSYSNNDL